MAEVLNVELRNSLGKRNSRRLRAAGSIPAVLYGHGKEVLSLSVPAHELEATVRHGARLVMLSGAVRQQAFVRELQWDTWGMNVLHVDFTRISAHEMVEVTVTLELRGEAPGLKEGGMVEQLVHELELECEATDVPEKIEVNVNNLGLNESITAGELELPSTAKIGCPADTVVVQCVVPTVAPEEEEALAGEPGEGEPEVIGRKPEEEEAESD